MLIKVTANDINQGTNGLVNPISNAIYNTIGNGCFVGNRDVCDINGVSIYKLPLEVQKKLIEWDVDQSGAEPFEFELEEITNENRVQKD